MSLLISWPCFFSTRDDFPALFLAAVKQPYNPHRKLKGQLKPVSKLQAVAEETRNIVVCCLCVFTKVCSARRPREFYGAKKIALTVRFLAGENHPFSLTQSVKNGDFWRKLTFVYVIIVTKEKSVHGVVIRMRTRNVPGASQPAHCVWPKCLKRVATFANFT